MQMKLYELDGRTYIFDSEAFQDLLVPKDKAIVRTQRIATFNSFLTRNGRGEYPSETVESWYKCKSCPRSIEDVQNIADFFHSEDNNITISNLILETDDIQEHIKKAASLDPDKTALAAKIYLREYMFDHNRIILYLIVFWSCIMYLYNIGFNPRQFPFLVIVFAEVIKFAFGTYFKTTGQKVLRWILLIVQGLSFIDISYTNIIALCGEFSRLIK